MQELWMESLLLKKNNFNLEKKFLDHDVFNEGVCNFYNSVGEMEIPFCPQSYKFFPNKVVPFETNIPIKKREGFIHFFIDDYRFERVWNNPKQYIDYFKDFDGVIMPDFSTYADMPMVLQWFNVYRNAMMYNILLDNDIKAIPTLSWSYARTIPEFTYHLEKGGIYAVSSNGIRSKDDIEKFCIALEWAANRLEAKKIIIVGKNLNKKFDFEVKYYNSFGQDAYERVKGSVE